jgi:hypothetical protein
MLGLSESEMMDGNIDWICSRLNGFLLLEKFRQTEEWKRSRLVAFVTAKSLGSTKAKSENDFLKLEDDGKKKTRLTDEQIKRLKEL